MIPARGPQTKFSENVLYGIVVLEHRLNVIRQDCNLYVCRHVTAWSVARLLSTHLKQDTNYSSQYECFVASQVSVMSNNLVAAFALTICPTIGGSQVEVSTSNLLFWKAITVACSLQLLCSMRHQGHQSATAYKARKINKHARANLSQ